MKFQEICFQASEGMLEVDNILCATEPPFPRHTYSAVVVFLTTQNVILVLVQLPTDGCPHNRWTSTILVAAS